MLIKASLVRKLAKQEGRRISKQFLVLLDDYIRMKIQQACRVHNGGRITLNAEIAGLVGLSKK